MGVERMGKMATKQVVTCDRCKKEQEDRVGFWCVSAGVGKYSGDSSWEKSFRQDWCNDCCKEFGIYPNPKKPENIERQAAITLEDMIREIVRSEIPA